MNDTEGERAIENSDALSVTPARASLLAIAEAGYRAIRTPEVIRRHVHCEGDTLTLAGRDYALSEYEHLYVLAVGKCSVDAASELESLLGDRITAGISLDVREGHGSRITYLSGTHPYPSAENAAHTKQLLELVERANEHDLVLMVISGGASALLCQPATHTPLEEANLIRHLFKTGATIGELNTVRKHLSKARGGGLAAAAHPAEVVSLIFSDVPGNDLNTIASGPTMRDATTKRDALLVLEKHRADKCGFSPEHLFETPKEGRYFLRVHSELVLTNKTALEAMQSCAQSLHYTPIIRDTELTGEARDVGAMIAAELHTARPRTVLLYGGETTVTIGGPGKGGRNEELALAALECIEEDELVTSLASDGRDNTDYAGAIADSYTASLARDAQLDPAKYLYVNDSFSFFHTLQQGIRTGYTGANVADLVIALKHERLGSLI